MPKQDLSVNSDFDLGYYHRRFPEVLLNKYKQTFEPGRRRIEEEFKRVRSGEKLLTAENILSIFKDDLPFGSDWTKPDLQQLQAKLSGPGKNVAVLIRAMRDRKDVVEALREILGCLRELSLTSLILHHVYPDRFAICSHHLASLLNVSGRTVSLYYARYCDELSQWSQNEWPENFTPNVAEVEFALWTWYRLASYGRNEDQRKHQNIFFGDVWIQKRRAVQVAITIGEIRKLDLARSYLDTDPTVAAIIAWRELETEIKKVLRKDEDPRTPLPRDFDILVNRLSETDLPPGLSKKSLLDGWKGRNEVMHNGKEVAEPRTRRKERAEKLLEVVTAFARHNIGGDDGALSSEFGG